MRTLLVDNHDSYTYNVFHLLAAASGEEPTVVNNDAVSWRVLARSKFDAFVLSPGPGRPERWHDFGVCRDILSYSEVPVLGICLGHQGIGNLLEGGVTSAPQPMHGRLSHVRHRGTGIFNGVPQDFSVVRYHSLAITGPVGPEGHVVAWADDGVVMGVEHDSRPMWGVQFHPESIATEFGDRIARNFFELAEQHSASSTARRSQVPRRHAEDSLQAGVTGTSAGVARASEPGAEAGASAAVTGEPEVGTGEHAWTVLVRTLEGAAPTEHLYERLFADAETSFWLDSADAPTWLAQCSYMGTSAGPAERHLSYDVDAAATTIRTAGGEKVRHGSIFELLDEETRAVKAEPPIGVDCGLMGGFVGYLGYELKADCGATNVHSSDLPDAAMMFANRVVAVDHARRRTHVFALVRTPLHPPVDGPKTPAHLEFSAHQHRGSDERVTQVAWLEEATRLAAAAICDPPPARPLDPPVEPGSHVSFRVGRGRAQYLADIERSQAELAAGESYEVCLTDQISTDASPDPFALYRRLRRSNPSPFAAFLRFGDTAIVSSSPERFLSVARDGAVQARPIKGTISRAEDAAEDAARKAELAGDEKTRAEHLMIVDLLRNDLGRVSEIDSVRVPDLMVVEPYATVHQVVSTVTGQLEPGRSPVECVRNCFPGGSMTGAPKERTMEIIDELEDEARGVYSGAIGYFGVDGSVDLSIVIRTIVIRPGRTTIGAGGAIVMQSDPEEEFDEILLKARAPMAAIAKTVTGRGDEAAWSVELEPGARRAEAA
ncbi:MAG TPA: aminodeoxychorismate synthase component I [Solirubrobacterales bacterium]|jgi:para-aminobenzoate synthetase|nr:aminodeoxychorismate synthase component I [Solirubrobacterales bacterium]